MRVIEKGTEVSFRSAINGDIKIVTGKVMSLMSLKEARRRGLVAKPRPDGNSRKSGTILEINAEVEPGHHKLLYKHRSLVRVVKPEKKEEEVKQIG